METQCFILQRLLAAYWYVEQKGRASAGKKALKAGRICCSQIIRDTKQATSVCFASSAWSVPQLIMLRSFIPLSCFLLVSFVPRLLYFFSQKKSGFNSNWAQPESALIILPLPLLPASPAPPQPPRCLYLDWWLYYANRSKLLRNTQDDHIVRVSSRLIWRFKAVLNGWPCFFLSFLLAVRHVSPFLCCDTFCLQPGPRHKSLWILLYH